MLKFNKALLLSSMTLAGSALACGPDFPMMLSSDRAQTFAVLTEPVFLVEVQALASAVPDFSAVSAKPDAVVFEDSYDYQNDKWISATEQAEQQLLNSDQAKLVQQMRQSATVQQALSVGEALPAELRFYTAAAVSFAQHDYQQAIELFRQVLALPLEQQQQRRSWALYSLGRALLQQNTQTQTSEVSALYSQLQQEVAAGLADPLQLAVASLGELWRTPSASILTIGVLGVSLTLPATLHLLVKNVQQVTVLLCNPRGHRAGISAPARATRALGDWCPPVSLMRVACTRVRGCMRWSTAGSARCGR